MKPRLLFVVFFFTSALCMIVLHAQAAQTENPAPQMQLSVDKPKDNGAVGDLADVEGKVSDPKAKVWVIVRPRGDAEFYVQGEVDVASSGKFSIVAHFGRKGQDYKQYQIRAVANPKDKDKLKTDQPLNAWPVGECSSDIITVTKSKLE